MKPGKLLAASLLAAVTFIPAGTTRDRAHRKSGRSNRLRRSSCAEAVFFSVILDDNQSPACGMSSSGSSSVINRLPLRADVACDKTIVWRASARMVWISSRSRHETRRPKASGFQ